MEIELPIEFKAELIPASWRLERGFPESWGKSGKWLGIRVKIPNISGKRSRSATHAFFSLDQVNARWRPRLTAEKRRTLERHYEASLEEGRDEPIEILVCQTLGGSNDIKSCDPLALREEFFNLKEKTTDLLNFLNRYGMWRLHFNPFGPGWTSVLSTKENPVGTYFRKDITDSTNRQIVTPEAVWCERAQIKQRIQTGSDALERWFKTSKESIVLEPIATFPFYSYVVRSVGDAVEASLSFDLLRGSHFALCKRSDCAKPFEVTRKLKQYCSPECAHLEVVRRSRRLAKNSNGGISHVDF